MKLRFWPKGRWLRVLLIFLGLILSPYVVSRVVSPWRVLRVASDGEVGLGNTEGRGLRVATYNIAHGRGLAVSNWDGGTREERLERLDEIAELLREMDADIVVLTEVDFDASWSFRLNQAEYLADKAGYPYRVEQRDVDGRMLLWTWKFGNAVLSRFPIANANVVDLPSYSWWEAVLAGKKRSVACDVRIGDESVRVVAVHFSYRSEAVRSGSSEVMLELAKASDHPVILAGDFNSTPTGFPRSQKPEGGKNAMEVLWESGLYVMEPREPTENSDAFTFHSTQPRSVIDWVVIPSGWRFDRYEVVDSELSDHRPVVVEVGEIDGGESR